MVSTRGGARTSVPEPDTMLKKKPVRKAAAKPTTATVPKTKATRTRKAQPEPEQEGAAVEEEEIDELAEPAPAPVKTTRRGRPPVKKDEEPTKKTAVVKATTKTKTLAKPTRSAAGNPTKATRSGEEKTEEKAEPRKAPELKPAQTRATRPTRATAAKEKAAPLSPKKITQVSKASSKKNDDSKMGAAKSSLKGRPVARGRGVSDENAGILDLKPSAARTQHKEVRSTGFEKTEATTKRELATDVQEDGTNAPEQVHDEAEPTTQEEDLHSEDELLADQGSDDELCAPKTPMKRCDPREQSRYSPAKTTQLSSIDVPDKTPVRRFQVLGTQQGTPQTQRPYCKPSVPMSEVRPMTVARARDTAMVFPKLQPLPQMNAGKLFANSNLESVVCRAATTAVEEEDVHMESPQEFVEQDSDTSLLVDASIADLSMSTVAAATVSAEDAIEENDEAEQPDDPNSYVVGPEENIVDEEMENDDTDMNIDFSHTTDDSVLITPQEIDSFAENSVENVEMQGVSGTPRPETMIWANIRQDVTIPFVFDGDASPARNLPQAEPTERLSIVADFASELRSEDDVDSTSESSKTAPIMKIAFTPDLSLTRQKECDRPSAEDVTVNMSDFLDVSSIAELRDSTSAHDETATEVDVDTVMAKNPTVEDIVEDESVLDGDVTLMCEEQVVPRFAISTPIKLTTVEDVTEEEFTADGEETLLIAESVCPATVERSPVKLVTAEDAYEVDGAAVEGDMTLSLEEPPCPRTVRRSPVKLTLVEDVPEEIEEAEGDLTLMLGSPLDSPLPQQPRTPALIDDRCSSNVTPLDLEDANTPHYARSTFSSRRKSISDGSRPTTSDGERRPVNAQPTASAWFDDVAASTQATPRRSRSSSAHSRRDQSRSRSRPRTPARTTGASTSSNAPTHGPPQTRTANSQSASRERFPGMPPAESYQELLESPDVEMSLTRSSERKASIPRVTPLKRKSLHEDDAGSPEAANPQQVLPERFPGMPSRSTYGVQTARPTTRFRTPTRQSPIRRPATTQKPTSLRKIALKAASTPMKAQLPAVSQTPGQVPMTPHPAAPLRGVVALVDVYTHDGACASQSFAILLKRLGAKTTKTFNENVTHLVFKEGAPKLLQALVLHNKQIATGGNGKGIFCVNSRWVNDCDARGRRMPELDEGYAVELDDYQRTAKRRRKSMEPMALLKTNGGSVVRDRKSSAGRVSIGRMSTKEGMFESPEESGYLDIENKENEDDGGCSEPATPAYLKAPDSLIQQTVPAKRAQKLDLGAKADKQRRLTFADGLEF
ncbi:Putative BRCT domain-containing protein [Septoria linicola]|uniref:BRCT domain-containing protein n=1 Tax=Septoria linicola TaxID=215465 RepID=A0A9Q9EDP2_9PEZI|nr:putative BRCT domain-containing protein [Septoria linicola]USW47956.1 Putative BRCT domain-containing protein [Septoria linicola]